MTYKQYRIEANRVHDAYEAEVIDRPTALARLSKLRRDYYASCGCIDPDPSAPERSLSR
jgi:hypothetical protein